MEPLIALGNVPEWISVVEATGSLLWTGIGRHQRNQALDFVRLVRTLSKMDDDQLHDVIDSSPRLAELTSRSWRAAVGSSAEAKRRLLATVAARALAGHYDDAAIDESAYLVATIEELQPLHMELLVAISRTNKTSDERKHTVLEGAWREEELLSMHERFGALLLPTLRVLDREGLILDRAVGTFGGGPPAWVLTDYGRLLLQSLQGCGIPLPALDEAEISLSWLSAPPGAIIRNIGLGVAKDLRVRGVEQWMEEDQYTERLDLAAGAEHFINLTATPRQGVIADGTQAHPFLLTVSWNDGRGSRSETADLRGLRSYVVPTSSSG